MGITHYPLPMVYPFLALESCTWGRDFWTVSFLLMGGGLACFCLLFIGLAVARELVVFLVACCLSVISATFADAVFLVAPGFFTVCGAFVDAVCTT